MKKFTGKWMLFALLLSLGLVALLFLDGYDTTGLCLLALAALVPLYHGLGLLRQRRPKQGRRLTMLFRAALLLALAAMGLTLGQIASAARGTAQADAQYLVVLGAGVNGTVPSRSLNERLDAARVYLETHPDAVAIVSGAQGAGEDITEAQCMYNALTGAGIDPSRVWMEPEATSTLENLRFSLALIQEKTGEETGEIAIVSSEYHLYRAGMFARWLGLEAQLVPAKTTILPLRWNYYIREIFAVWYYTLLGGTQ